MGVAWGKYGRQGNKPERKNLPERPRFRLLYAINANLKEIGWGFFSAFIWLRIWKHGKIAVNTLMVLPVPLNGGYFLTSWGTVNFSRRIVFHWINQPYSRILSQCILIIPSWTTIIAHLQTYNILTLFLIVFHPHIDITFLYIEWCVLWYVHGVGHRRNVGGGTRWGKWAPSIFLTKSSFLATGLEMDK